MGGLVIIYGDPDNDITMSFICILEPKRRINIVLSLIVTIPDSFSFYLVWINVVIKNQFLHLNIQGQIHLGRPLKYQMILFMDVVVISFSSYILIYE